MTKPADPQSEQSTELGSSIRNGGVSIADGQVDVGGDITGRDKFESAGHDIIHIEPGATAYFGAAPDVARHGLLALYDLMQRSPEVRHAVVAFQTDFRATCQQLDVVADYKGLHDLLHQLQFQCYEPLVRETPRFPDDDHVLDILNAVLLDLEDVVGQLHQVVLHSSLPARETTWISVVDAARVDLSNALDTLNSSLLRQVIRRLRSLLAIQLSHINDRLNQAADTLRLQALTEALAHISNRVQSLKLDAELITKFRDGVEALDELGRSLTAMVDDHHHWQAIEVELWRLEGSLAQDMSELELTWPDLKVEANALCSATGVEWAATLRKESESLTAAVASGNPVAVKRAFTGYRRRASNHFFEVDAYLKVLCRELSNVGVPLSSVLRMIE